PPRGGDWRDRRGARSPEAFPGSCRRGPRCGTPRLPGRSRPRRHLRVPPRPSDPRHSDRHRHVAPSSWAAYPEAGTGGAGRGGPMSEVDPRECDWCEEVLQPYLDRDLSEADRIKVTAHLAKCKWCDDRYKFEG